MEDEIHEGFAAQFGCEPRFLLLSKDKVSFSGRGQLEWIRINAS
jgi:hypothetical protein